MPCLVDNQLIGRIVPKCHSRESGNLKLHKDIFNKIHN